MRTTRLPLAARYGPRLPRLTARLRLTVLYGGLFLVCGAGLVCTTYLLVSRAQEPGLSMGHAMLIPGTRGASPEQSHQLQVAVHHVVASQAASDLGQLLIQSWIALGIVSVAAFALGWLAAGRILRPLATMTATARRISATSLHERLGLPGPGDELKELGDTLDGLFDRLEASFEAQRHFVANASHELRTPISRERAMLQVALDDPCTTAEEWRWTSREVLASNTEQERLIEALLTLATSEGGVKHREPVDLSAITEETLLALRPETGRLGLHVEVITKPALLLGDAVLTERLVANLTDNAVRHNVPDGYLRITTGTSRDRAVLSVSSTGPVIPPDQVDRLFQPFQRLHPRGNGNGLGLSIVRAIANAHGATITAQAPPAGGLAVTVAFPAPPAPGTATVNPTLTRRNRSSRSGPPGRPADGRTAPRPADRAADETDA
jgi:signal transduction histidine kinase